MSQLLVLDSGIVGLLTHPNPGDEARACASWFRAHIAAGDIPVIPAMVDYEVRREYLRMNSVGGLAALDRLTRRHLPLPLTVPGWRRAAELWAWARQSGHMTAPWSDLNIDLLLAAQAQLLADPAVSVVVATSNVRHLAPLVDARLWRDIP